MSIDRDIDPLVLSLSDDGLQRTNFTNQKGAFDMNADGLNGDLTSWIQGKAGFLAYDRNGNQRIDNISELFSEFSVCGARAGLEALAQKDSDQNYVIDSRDHIWSDLSLWIDANGDARTDVGELQSLDSSGIVRLFLDGQEVGNLESSTSASVVSQSSYETTDGFLREMSEVIFSDVEFQGVV